MTANIHGFLHLPEVVRNLSPLWAHSCFPYEDANGELLTLFHGSHAVEKQVYVYACRLCIRLVCVYPILFRLLKFLLTLFPLPQIV